MPRGWHAVVGFGYRMKRSRSVLLYIDAIHKVVGKPICDPVSDREKYSLLTDSVKIHGLYIQLVPLTEILQHVKSTYIKGRPTEDHNRYIHPGARVHHRSICLLRSCPPGFLNNIWPSDFRHHGHAYLHLTIDLGPYVVWGS